MALQYIALANAQALTLDLSLSLKIERSGGSRRYARLHALYAINNSIAGSPITEFIALLSAAQNQHRINPQKQNIEVDGSEMQSLILEGSNLG